MSRGTTSDKVVDERVYEVHELTRVEGEGSLRLRVKDGEVIEARLGIFEAPRYFEQLVVGRTPDEVIDMVARICGICPVAYQMSAVHGFEDLFGVRIDPQSRALRRLLYCGEWIESHSLHIFFLHAPDFLGYDSGITMAADHRPLVEQALKMKKAGNHLIKILGGRPIHPVSVRVGGWSRVPRVSELKEHRAALEEALAFAQETVKLVAGFTMPAFAREPRLVSLRHAGEYPFNDGRIVSSDGVDLPPTAWRDAFEEFQVEGSNALHARSIDGKGVYLLGPAARVVLAGEQLHPLAKEALAATGYDRADPDEHLRLHRGPRGGARPRLCRGDRHHRRLPGPVRSRSWHGRAAPASRRGRRRRRAASSSIATRWTSPGGSGMPRSCRRPARTRPPSRRTSSSRRSRSWTCRTRRPPSGSSR